MSKQRKKISIYDVARTFTPEELAKNKRIGKMRIYLGIYPILDGYTYDDEVDAIEVPSMYKSLSEYDADKEYASNCIFSRKQVPQPLVQKLVAARKELEKRRVLEPLSNKEE